MARKVQDLERKVDKALDVKIMPDWRAAFDMKRKKVNMNMLAGMAKRKQAV